MAAYVCSFLKDNFQPTNKSTFKDNFQLVLNVQTRLTVFMYIKKLCYLIHVPTVFMYRVL